MRVSRTIRSRNRSGFENKENQQQNDFTLSYVGSNYQSTDEFKNRFKIKQEIGIGGQGQIKLAHDNATDDDVALKIFKKRKMMENQLEFTTLGKRS